MILFDLGLYSKLPLGTPDKMANDQFPIPFSFIYGERDWVRTVDVDAG